MTDVAPGTGAWIVTLETDLDAELTAELDRLYRRSFDPLLTNAAARHVLSPEEFAEEMADPRIDKYVARSPAGRVVGLTTLTADLDAVPWISADFFRHRWPEHAASRRLYYLGFTLAAPGEQRSGVFEAMCDVFGARLNAEEAVMAWDMCGFNVDAGFAAACAALFGGRGTVPPAVVDTQTYYAATFDGSDPRRAAPG